MEISPDHETWGMGGGGVGIKLGGGGGGGKFSKN